MADLGQKAIDYSVPGRRKKKKAKDAARAAAVHEKKDLELEALSPNEDALRRHARRRLAKRSKYGRAGTILTGGG